MATVRQHKNPHAPNELLQCVVKLVIDQFAIIQTPRFIEAVRLEIVPGVRHLAAVPRIGEEEDVVPFQFRRCGFDVGQDPIACRLFC